MAITGPFDDPLAVPAGTLVEAANGLQTGQLITWLSGNVLLASNSSAGYVAYGVVVAAEPERFWFVSRAGEVVRLDGHGFGTAGTKLWLGTGGAFTTTKPVGSSVRTVQLVGVVIGADHIIFRPPDPFSF